MIEPKKFIVGQTISELPGNTLNAYREGELRDRNLASQSKLSNGYYAAPQASACVQLAWTGDEDLLPGSAVVLTTPIHTYEDKPSAPYSGVKFFCELPTVETEENGFFAITATPLAAAVGGTQSVGYGYIPNACWAQVNVTDEAHETAVLADGETLLQSAASGRVPIIWKPTGTGTKWCVAALSPGGGGTTIAGWGKVIDVPAQVTTGITAADYAATPDPLLGFGFIRPCSPKQQLTDIDEPPATAFDAEGSVDDIAFQEESDEEIYYVVYNMTLATCPVGTYIQWKTLEPDGRRFWDVEGCEG